jgi:hypothetical protein
MFAENGGTPASLLVRCKKPRILHIRVLFARSSPNRMARYNHEVVKAQCGRRSPFRQRLYDAAKKRDIILRRRGVEVKGAEVEQEGEGEEGGEEQGAQVGQACGGAEKLGEGTGRVVMEVVEDSASASWVERDWCGQHD